MSKPRTSPLPPVAKKQVNIRLPEALAVRLHIVARVRGKTTAEWASAQLQRSVDQAFARNANLGAMEEALSKLAHKYLPVSDVEGLLGLADIYAKADTRDGLDTYFIGPEAKGSAMSKTVVVDPIHPGEILREDFLLPLNISQTKLASDLVIPRRRINEIILGKRPITTEMATLLAGYFGNSREFWLNLQSHYDLECRRDAANALKKERTKTTKKRVPRRQA